MAHVTGTSATALAYYNNLISFLTTNAALVAANQDWDIVWTATAGQGAGVVLRGPGLSSQDQVYVGMRLFQNVPSDQYWIEFVGMTAILPSASSYRDHVNVSPLTVRMFLSAGAMTHWFIANGRRFIAVAKISTVFESAYCGFIMPYAVPTSYPYPLLIGACAGDVTLAQSPPLDWRSESVNHRNFMSPQRSTSQIAFPSASMLDPAGTWQQIANIDAPASIRIGPENMAGDYFHTSPSDGNSYQADYVRSRQGDAFGGTKALLPATLVQVEPTDQTFGVFDGAFRCQGFANASENLITVNGVNHLVVQNVFRTGLGEYMAVALE